MEDFDFGSDSDSDGDVEFESEAAKIEVGQNYAVYTDDDSNMGDPFYLVRCDHPLHVCEETYTDGWDCTWQAGTMLVGGYYYRRIKQSGGRHGCTYYELLMDRLCAMNFSHLVVKHHYPMIQYKTDCGNPRFKMSASVRGDILSDIEERQRYAVQ